MAEAVVSFVLESLGDLLIEEAKFLHGVGGQVQQIHDELRWMQTFLKDADTRQNEDERIRVWVADVRSLAYDAGDVLESFLLGVESKRRGGIKNILKRYVCILNECVVLHKVGSEMQGIKARISELNTRKETYGIRLLPEGSGVATDRQSQLRRSYSHVSQDDFVSLEGDVENLVMQLVSDRDGDEKYYQVVSICGMGGLGKTTLAQKIYNHPKVKCHFAAFAWVCISQQWQTKEVLQKVLIKLLPEQRNEFVKLEEEELIRKLFNIQQDKHCLVVFDDIWSKDAWDCLKSAFHIGKRNSKLLLTSRNIEVATHVDPEGLLYQPRFLKDDECWELLKKKAFVGRDQRDAMDVKEMEELGKEMVKHCRGLPLAVIVLGGLLATKDSLREWQMVQRSIRSYLRKGEGVGQQLGGGVSDIFTLSYNDLPYQLKPCYLYLAQFAEDTELEVERLYQLWTAESMVLSKDRGDGETMMNVAERYLSELAHRCLIQVQLEEEESCFRRHKSCKLHDLMRDLCTFKAKEEDFFSAVGSGVGNAHEFDDSSSSSTINNRTRRLVFYYNDEDTNSRNVSLGKKTSKHLRSLLFWNPSEDYDGLRRMPRIIRSQLKDFKLLRVLDIDGLQPYDPDDHLLITILKYGFNILRDHHTIPKAIGNLIHLRYLSLRGTFALTFPTFLSNLKHLQTLNLEGCEFLFFYHQCMANMLRKMGRLQYLYLPDVPEVRSKTTKLRLDDVCNLEVLTNFDTSWCNAEDLIKLTNLRKLIANVDTKLEDLERIVLHLITLAPYRLQYSSLQIELDFRSEKGYVVLRQLFGCQNLHKLSISGCLGSKLPLDYHDHHFNFSSSLTSLSLFYSHLEEDPMPSLGSIPNLRNLFLYGESFVGKEMVCSAMGFSQLISLNLFRLPELEKWRVDEGAMPKLSRLVIEYCKKLEMLPDGLQFVTTLRDLEITRMPEAFNDRVRVVGGKEGEDFYKIQHVPSILIQAEL